MRRVLQRLLPGSWPRIAGLKTDAHLKGNEFNPTLAGKHVEEPTLRMSDAACSLLCIVRTSHYVGVAPLI